MATYGWETEGLPLVHKFADQVRGRTFLLTGPTPGGIGAETATSLATESPGMIVLVGRSPAKTRETVDAIKAIDPSISVKSFEADLSSLKSVRRTAEAISGDPEIGKIDVLINNAGIMASPFQLTEDRLELQLAANHLGHFVLTNRLLPKIIAAGSGARIVQLTSSAHRGASVRLEDPNFSEAGSYDRYDSYCQSKTANILFALALNRRLVSRFGIRAYAAHPGSVASGLQEYMNALPQEQLLAELDEASKKIYDDCSSLAEARAIDPRKSLQQGCATTLRAALDPDLVNEEGVYLRDCQLTTDPKWLRAYAVDEELAEKTWALSERLVGEKFDIQSN